MWSKEGISGFVGKNRSGEVDLVVNIKKNSEGCFLSFLFLSHAFRRGVWTICVPQGEGSRGWICPTKCFAKVIYGDNRARQTKGVVRATAVAGSELSQWRSPTVWRQRREKYILR